MTKDMFNTLLIIHVLGDALPDICSCGADFDTAFHTGAAVRLHCGFSCRTCND